jgi:predicted extracellular nuclease
VETTPSFDPGEDGIDFDESLEGMLVQLDDPIAVGPTNQYGETPVVGDRGALATPRSVRGGVVATQGDFNPERLVIDDTLADVPVANVGDVYPGAMRAVVDYAFGNYMLHPLTAPVREDGGLRREVTDAATGDQLAIASFNVENLDPTDSPDKFARLADILVHNLHSPDLVAVEEIQDDDGAGTADTTDASLTWRELIAAVQSAGGPAYDYRQIDPEYGTDGGEPGGNIRQGYLFRTDRALSFVDRPGGTATSDTTVVGNGKNAHLSASPGRILPRDPAFKASRKPLAGEFRWHNKPLFVVANHFNSKGGDDPLFGRRQPPQFPSETQRHQQATIVNDFVADLEAANPRANVVVLGDLNDFDFSRTLDILEGDELVNLMDLLPLAERYSYVYEGNSEVLDQILVSRPLLQGHPEYDSVHVNAEFADQASDHDPQVARLHVLGPASP